MHSDQALSRADVLVANAGPASDAGWNPPVRAIWISVVALLLLYVALFLLGVRFFVFKTMVLPVILAYGLMVRQRVAFMADWLPLLSATVLFDALRGAIWIAIDRGYQNFHIDYVIALERALFGTPSTSIAFQQLRTPALDMMAVIIHGSHFVYFLFFGLVLWHVRREHFRLFRRALVFVMMLGLMGYAVIPTAPPWIAAIYYDRFGPIAHVTEGIYTLYASELYGSFATNPVAAMPSLHVAFPVMCALVGWRAYGRRIGAALALYAVAVALVAIYLGEHYAVDAIAGALVAWLSVALGQRMASVSLSFRGVVATSAAMVALTTLIVFLCNHLPEVTY